MKTFDERVKELSAVILTTRDFCGNEYEAANDYFADEGFPRGVAPERERLRFAALDMANDLWRKR